MQIIDSQVHVWRAETPDRPWPRVGVAPVHMSEPLGYETLLAMMRNTGIDRAVLVPPSWEGDRVDYALEAAQAYPDRFAVMGRIALDRPESRGLLARWKAQPGMLGVRLTFVWEKDKAWLTDGTADWFWPEAERAGLPVMVIAPDAMARLGEIAARHPGLKLIVDHMGLSQRFVKDGTLDAAVDRTVALADHPNVYVKVSGLLDYSAEPYPCRDMLARLRRVTDAFGARRCFWGTDLSRMLPRFSYRQCVTFITEEAHFLSAEDKEWVMGRAIAECLDWPPVGRAG